MKIKRYEDLRKINKSFTRRSYIKCGMGAIKTLFKKIPSEYDLTIVTNSIAPELTRISYHFMSQIIAHLNQNGIKSKLLIIDCSGNLPSHYAPNAVVERFPKFDLALTLDYFTSHYVKSKLVWVSDDDSFVFEPNVAIEAVNSFYSDTNLAAFSFRPRDWWHFELGGAKIRPMSSYCVMLNRDIIKKEKLSFTSGGRSNPYSGKGYDVADFMHFQLLNNGYAVKIPDEPRWICHLGGGSSTAVLGSMCSRNELIEYFSSPFSYGNHFTYNLKSFYISAKVSKIYKKLFGEDAPSIFSEAEVRTFLDRVPYDKIRERNFKELALVDENVDNILKHC